MPSAIRAGEEADDEIRALPFEMERVEPGSGQPPRVVFQLLRPRRPRRHGIRLVEAADVADLAPEPLQGICLGELRIDEARPPRGRETAPPSS